mgnify:CR=1 FL=1
MLKMIAKTEEVALVASDNKKQVKIPRQVRLEAEFFVGFGMEELIKTLIVGAVVGVIAYLFYLFTRQTIIATLLVIGAISISVIALIKGGNNFSMLDMIKNIVKYEFMQKEYRYERGDFNTKAISKRKDTKS